jgi:glycosyltransferase involved in cell wall biosynthesis
MKLGIVINVYNETTTLKNALESIQGIYDELHIAISSDNKETLDICKQYTDKIYKVPQSCYWMNKKGEKRYHFGKARNFVRNKCKTDWIMYLDADDILVGGEKIRPFLEENKDANVIQMNYVFNQNCTLTTHRISKKGKWEGRQHECLYADYPWVFLKDVYVKHDYENHREEKLQRNLDDCLEEYLENPDHTRAYNLARSYSDMHDYKNAIKFYKECLRAKGSDKYFIYRVKINIGECMLCLQDIKGALRQFVSCQKYAPQDALWCFQIGYCYCLLRNYKEAIAWLNQGTRMGKPEHCLYNFNPRQYEYEPRINLYNCLYLTGRLLEAYMVVGDSLLYFPEDKLLLNLKDKLWATHGEDFRKMFFKQDAKL